MTPPDLFDHFGAAHAPAWPDGFGEAMGAWAADGGPAVPTLSLFSGAGALDLGFQQAGFDVRLAVELDPACVRSLRANAGPGGMFPHLTVAAADVAQFAPPPDSRFDLVLGCPPCQTFSAAGRRAEGVNGVHEPRGTLFRAYTRLLRKLRPKAFVFENVAGITGADGGRAWAEMLRAFTAARYRVTHRVLDAADYGVPQHRERMILVGVRSDLGVTFRFPAPTHGPDSTSARPHTPAGLAVRGATLTAAERRAAVGGRYGHLLAAIPPGLNYSFYTARLGHPAPVFAWRSKFSDFLYKADPAVPSRTLIASGGGFTGPFHWHARPFAPAERKRLQTIPDAYALCGNRSEVNAQIGNAVPCQLARVLALAVRSQVFGTPLPFALGTLGENDTLNFRRRKWERTREYARLASPLALVAPVASVASSVRRYRARFGEKLNLVEDDDAVDGLWVEARRTRSVMRVRMSRGRRHGPAAFTVVLTAAAGKEWPQGLRRIELKGDSLDSTLFAAGWRALDAELARTTGCADLVQLHGYYRSPPTANCSLAFAVHADGYWPALERVMGRLGVGDTLTVSQLAAVWGLAVREVRPFATFLRSIGYEVRTRNTNARISGNRVLVPYPFPTLTPKSVMFHKPL